MSHRSIAIALTWSYFGRSRCEPKRMRRPLVWCKVDRADGLVQRVLGTCYTASWSLDQVGYYPHERRSPGWSLYELLRWLVSCLDLQCHRNRFGLAAPGMAPEDLRTTRVIPLAWSPYRWPHCAPPMCFRPLLSVPSLHWPSSNFAWPLCRLPRLEL